VTRAPSRPRRPPALSLVAGTRRADSYATCLHPGARRPGPLSSRSALAAGRTPCGTVLAARSMHALWRADASARPGHRCSATLVLPSVRVRAQPAYQIIPPRPEWQPPISSVRVLRRISAPASRPVHLPEPLPDLSRATRLAGRCMPPARSVPVRFRSLRLTSSMPFWAASLGQLARRTVSSARLAIGRNFSQNTRSLTEHAKRGR